MEGVGSLIQTLRGVRALEEDASWFEEEEGAPRDAQTKVCQRSRGQCWLWEVMLARKLRGE